MANERDSWRQTFSAFGEALVGVVQAEVEVIAEAWKRSAREIAIAMGLLAAAAYVALVCLPALLILALVAGLVAVGMPIWGAALVVAAVVGLVLFVVVKIALKRLAERCESPVSTVKARVSDHSAWWHERILQDDDKTLGEANDGADDEADVAPAGRQRNNSGDGSAGEPPARA